MFGSAVLEVAIGIVFVFLLVSLICSQIGNKISEALKWRAIELENGIRDLVLHGDPAKLRALYDNPLIKSLTPRETSIQMIADHLPWLRIRPKQLPIDIPPRTFVLALFNTFVPNSQGQTNVTQLYTAVKQMPDSALKQSLVALVTAKEQEIDAARKNVENWFNGAMDRVSESYKRNMWRLALIIGLGVSVVMNVDAIAIASNLWRDPTLRAGVAAAAEQYERNQEHDEAAKVLNQLDLPIGWQATRTQSFPWFEPTPKDWLTPQSGFEYPTALALKLVGWLITGLAGAQGAPFWFDLLKKLTQRDSGPATA